MQQPILHNAQELQPPKHTSIQGEVLVKQMHTLVLHKQRHMVVAHRDTRGTQRQEYRDINKTESKASMGGLQRHVAH